MTGIVIADDHAAFAGALAAVLEDRGMTVLAVEHTPADTLACIETCRPELCVLDRWFDDGDVLGILPKLRAASPDTRIVVVSADLDRRLPRAVIDAGAHGFVHKTRGVAALLDALAHPAGVVVIEIPPRWAGGKGASRAERPRAYGAGGRPTRGPPADRDGDRRPPALRSPEPRRDGAPSVCTPRLDRVALVEMDEVRGAPPGHHGPMHPTTPRSAIC